ncbi:hypothetical protein BbiDN127_H0013 (plasmid) [Borreliella bissettiae DN127]|uniref:Uncharacterized protein n=1 Tax=Borrelia bissettiae (strain DSM 17990 / CIP 109136 / DN127) TaxID=521010 RepID=G0AP48_BORBD|nr:hypothetical protein BbiDN127_H0013 [Borreliella bissettiae DN127]
MSLIYTYYTPIYVEFRNSSSLGPSRHKKSPYGQIFYY